MLSLGHSQSTSRSRDGGSRSGSVQGRRSGEIIEEEDEDELEVEEVEEFSPIRFGEDIQEEAVEDSPSKSRR